MGEGKSDCPIHQPTSRNDARVSYFRTREHFKVSQVSRPPPCPEGGYMLNHPAHISLSFFFLLGESPEKSDSETLPGSNPRSLLCATNEKVPGANSIFSWNLPTPSEHSTQGSERQKRGGKSNSRWLTLTSARGRLHSCCPGNGTSTFSRPRMKPTSPHVPSAGPCFLTSQTVSQVLP